MGSSNSWSDVRWWRAALMVFCVAAVGQAMGLWSLDRLLAMAPPLCPVRLLTGHTCPGCGMGHALVLLAHGRLAASLHAHPFGLPLVLWCAAVALMPQALQHRVYAWKPLRTDAVPAALTVLLIVWWCAHP